MLENCPRDSSTNPPWPPGRIWLSKFSMKNWIWFQLQTVLMSSVKKRYKNKIRVLSFLNHIAAFNEKWMHWALFFRQQSALSLLIMPHFAILQTDIVFQQGKPAISCTHTPVNSGKSLKDSCVSFISFYFLQESLQPSCSQNKWLFSPELIGKEIWAPSKMKALKAFEMIALLGVSAAIMKMLLQK